MLTYLIKNRILVESQYRLLPTSQLAFKFSTSPKKLAQQMVVKPQKEESKMIEEDPLS